MSRRGFSSLNWSRDQVGTALIVLFAALVRFWALGRPNTLVFDETYYVKDAFTLWQLGFEARWPTDIDTLFAAGEAHLFYPDAAFVVHPQVGKWLIALGIAAGGVSNSWAWRLSNAVVGVFAVWLVIRIARRLFASTTMGLIAGLLMAIDGAAIVHSRIALLDQFLMIFVLAAFYALLRDRAQFSHRFRWWRVFAGVLLGLAIGVKWSGAYFLAGFGLLTVLWDLSAYRAVARARGIRFWKLFPNWLSDAGFAFLSLVPVAALTYLASWFSWFITPGAWGRDWAANNSGAGITWLPPLLRSWVHYHGQMWTFHTGLDGPHPYASPAITWLLQIRPTAFFWGTEPNLANYPGCTRLTFCSMAINSIGNPILWWLATLAILITIGLGVYLRDWRALAVLSGIIFGWLPWLLYPERTVFAYYGIVFLPWLIFTLCYVFSIILNWYWGQNLIATTLTVIMIVSIVFYPIWTALPVERAYWQWLMWFDSWI